MESDFRSSVFRLCKKLQSDPRTEAVRNTIHNLHVAAQTDNVTQMPKPGHGDLGYIARNQHLQFLGYLLTDEAVEKINQQQPFQATHLEKAERSLVEEAHETIVFFIQSCMEDLTAKYPRSSLLIDPYFQYKRYSKKTEATCFLQTEEIADCIAAFKAGKVYQKLINNDALIVLENVNEDLIRQLSSIQRKQYEKDMDTVSKETEEYLMRLHTKQMPEIADVLLTYCTYCYALQGALQIASQMIFDAILNVSMAVMNNNNIIELTNHTNDIIYEKYEVLLNDIIIGIENGVGNIALLVCETPAAHKIKDFGIITSLTLNLISEFGSTSKVTMITVDKELNRIHSFTDAIMETDLGKTTVVYKAGKGK